MKLFYYPIFLVLLIAGLASCDQKEKLKELVSEEGMRYIHHIHNEGIPVDSGNIIELHLRLYDYKDSIIRDTYAENSPFPFAIQVQTKNPLKDIIFKVADGDSLTVFVPVEDLLGGQPMPPFLMAGTDLRHELKIIKVYSKEEYQKVGQERMVQQQLEMQEKMEKQKGLDDAIIAEHLATNGLTDKAQKTASGLYYVLKDEGAGELAAVGDSVWVHYNGTLLDGTKFDASYDRGQPYAFPLGRKQVIAGWDEGVALLKKGGKATLYVPSHLGYGPQARSQVIKAFSILKFEVDLVNVKKNQ